jgi:hypothetical protein
MLAKAAMTANSFLLAISTNASTLASKADDLRLVCHVCQLCHVGHILLADMGQNGQNVAVGAQHFYVRRDDDDDVAAGGNRNKVAKELDGFICILSP